MKGSEQDLVRIDASRRIRPDRSNPNVLEAALAYATEAEGIATGIYPLGRSLGKSREPLRAAEELAMLDAISGGRLIAGFPVGLAYDANVNNGVPPAETRLRFDENLELVLKAWREPHPFPWNGRFHQHPAVNIWPRPLQPNPPVFITGIGNPRTMEFCLQRGFGFNYFGWFGAKVAGRRIFDRFWEAANRLGKDDNPYQMGFMQTICVADTDAKAEKLFARHAEYFFQKGIGSHPDGAAVAARRHRHQGPASSSSATPATSGSTRGCARRGSPSSSTPDR